MFSTSFMKTPEETCHHRSSGTGAKREVEGCGVPRLRLFYFGLYEHITVIIDPYTMVFYSYMMLYECSINDKVVYELLS